MRPSALPGLRRRDIFPNFFPHPTLDLAAVYYLPTPFTSLIHAPQTPVLNSPRSHPSHLYLGQICPPHITMVSKKAAAKAAKPAPSSTSKLSTAASPNAALAASAFSPASFRLSLFASVVLGLDAYRLRIHDTNTGRLRSEHVFEAGVRVNSVSWVALASAQDRKSSKKRRRKADGGDVEEKNAAVAVTTNKGSVILYSATEGTVAGVLEGAHVGEVVAFEAEKGGNAWSVGVDGKLVEWDLVKKVALR